MKCTMSEIGIMNNCGSKKDKALKITNTKVHSETDKETGYQTITGMEKSFLQRNVITKTLMNIST